jgi:rhodanese-related sulfurtransferase
MLYHSVHEKLLPLPDATRVYPAHGAGSLCGKQLSEETVSTIGEQRRTNYALQPMSEPDFIELVTADQPDAPSYFTYDAVLNTKERPTLSQMMEHQVKPLNVDVLFSLQAVGAQVVDVRDPAEYARAHLKGSINIGLGVSYATWAGTILDREKPIVIIAEPGRQEEAAMRLGRIGFDSVVGYLRDGIAALENRTDLMTGTTRVTPGEAAAALASSSKPLIVDVRTPKEFQEARIEGSVNIPLNHLLGRLDEIPANRPVLVNCAGGYRSSLAAGLLQRQGRTNLTELAGGIMAWEAAGLPVLR